jgi:hypothetical protein
MNAAYVHLLANHVPMFALMAGLLLLVWGLARNSRELRFAAYAAFIVASLGVIVAYLSGGAAKSLIQDLSGGTQAAIERHQDAATAAVVLICLTGIAGIAAFFAEQARFVLRTSIVFSLFVLALIALAAAGYTADLGGLIQRAEITAQK